MFDKSFYPTPDNVIEIMLDGLKIDRRTKVLEPSAGKGNILDYIHDNLCRTECSSWYARGGLKEIPKHDQDKLKSKLFAIEKNIELQGIIQAKGYKLIDEDFLTHESERSYDLIIGNPPFDKGHHHLLKALEIDPYAEIRFLLNAETIRNPYSRSRQLLIEMLSERNTEYQWLKNCFSDAERQTDVEVVLVKVKAREKKNHFNFDFSGINKNEKMYTVNDIQNNQIETADKISSIVHRYNQCKRVIAEIKSKEAELAFYSNGLINQGLSVENESYESIIDTLRHHTWDAIFSQTKLSNIVTNDVLKEIKDHQESHYAMSINESNIFNLLMTFTMAAPEIRNKCIQSAFDSLTNYHEKNKVHIEGWKTNSAWKINRKVIVPWFADTQKYCSKRSGYVDWRKREKIEDVEKALCFVAGVKYDEIKDDCLSTKLYVYNAGEWQDSYFFEWKWFYKGTLHMKFKDEQLWNRFNYEACKGKNWLGGEFV